MFVYESVPGTAVTNFAKTEGTVSFSVEGQADAQITLELEAETEYKVSIGNEEVGNMTTNLGGKLSFSVELSDGVEPVLVTVEKC